jgi:hypothetical protein
MYPDCRVLFGTGVPVLVSGGYSREARKILGRHGLRCACHRSSSLLKELSQPFGCDDEADHRFTRDVAPGMLCAGRHMDVIARFRSNPLVALCALPQRLDSTRDDEKVLRVGVTVKRNIGVGGIVPFNTQKSLCLSSGDVRNSNVGPKSPMTRPVVGFFSELIVSLLGSFTLYLPCGCLLMVITLR